MDEFYRDLISEKTHDALAYKRSKGQQYTHIAPLGFMYVEGQMVPNPQEQTALDIIEQCRKAKLGARRTIRHLKKAGYRGRMGVTTVHRILHRGESMKQKLPANYFAEI